MQRRRGSVTGDIAAKEAGLSEATYYRLERGARGPSAQQARALARWLGWTTDQVLDAAEQAAPMTTDGPAEVA